MDALTLGPLMLPMPSLYLLMSVLLFFLGCTLAERSPAIGQHIQAAGTDLSRWSQRVFWGGLISGRLGYALAYPHAYQDDPLQLLYFWQPGYSVSTGLAVAGIYSLYFFRRHYLLQLFAMCWLLTCTVIWWLLITTQPLGAKEVRRLPEISLSPLATDQPVTSLTDLPKVILSDQNKPVIINLWASWCAPCRREMPALVRFAQQHPDIKVWLVNQGESQEQVYRFIGQQTPVIPANLILLDHEQQLAQHFESPGLPMTLAFSQGAQADLHIGELSTARLLTMKERLLQRADP